MPFKDKNKRNANARAYDYKYRLPGRVEAARRKLNFLESEAKRLGVYHLIIDERTQTNDN